MHSTVLAVRSFTKVVKLTFARGARIPSPARLFNSSLEGNTRRAIDIHEGTQVDAPGFKTLVMAAVAENGPPAKAGAKAKPINPRKGEKVVLLSDKNRRSLDIHEGAHLDEAQTATWVKEAAVLPGWVPGRPS